MELCLLLLAILVLGVGCGADDDDNNDNNWIGTWYIESIAGEAWEDESPNAWTFHEDGTYDAQFDGDTFDGFYTLIENQYTLYDHAGNGASGTWQRSGDTLTIFSDKDGVMILKKK